MRISRTGVVAVTSAALLTLAMAATSVAQDEADGHLARILEAGVIRMSTDPTSPPRSELSDGRLVGFDIDVGAEIAVRLGVEIAFETPDFSLVTAGSWGDRWDFSVGSMTITSAHEEVIDFARPYYFTPAQMAAHADLGYQSLGDLAGQSICMREASTYVDWMGGSLDFGSASPDTLPPEGSTAVTRPNDLDCAEGWRLGQLDFQGWLSSGAIVQAAIDSGLPVVAIGDPVFFEPLAAGFDKSVEDNDSLVAAVDGILEQMHEDGTLSDLSTAWFGVDLTRPTAG